MAGHQGGLGAVHRAQCRSGGLRQDRLGEQGQLAVEDDPGRATGHRRNGRTGADAAAGPDRDVHTGLGEQPLE